MNTILFSSLLLFFVAFVVADPPFPNTPIQFQANAKITMEGIFPQTIAGVYYYDFINQKTRVDQTLFGDTSTTLQDFTTMFQYEYDARAQQCKCSQMTDPIQPASVPPGSTYNGQTTIGTSTVEIWDVTNPVMEAAGLSMIFYVDSNDYVVRINNTIASFMGSQTTLMDLSNYVVGAPAASVFAVPSYCNGQCPVAPQPPTPGSCPGSPGPVCQCASATSLSFCVGVTYPIVNTISVQTMDTFVQQAYSALTLALPNPSQKCLDNFKAFLCAFYFPVCASDSQVPFQFLPCPDLCPLCGCGDLFTGNCTVAPSSNVPCTAYGTGFC